jgi:hypothetical protein
MSPFKSILVIATALSCLIGSLSASALSSSTFANSSNTTTSSQSSQSSTAQSSQIASISSQVSSQQAELATNLPNGKKALKKKLSLDYTHPQFETELNPKQKQAILTSLKKWKGELPVNNTFTVTSWADLKTETKDDKKQSKKKNTKTPNALVVYMWASTPNPKWDNNKPFDAEDYESGDPRFIRTEFNVLLKQDKKNNWSASIERDTEVKTESVDLVESPEDSKVMQDLFATNKADNALTEVTDILVETSSSVSSLSSNSSSILSSLSSNLPAQSSISSTSISLTSSNSKPSSSVSTQSSVSTNISNSNSSKSISFLDAIFGSVKANAADTDYSWPWKAGDTWTVVSGRDDLKCRTTAGYQNSVYGWHGCGEYSGFDGNGNPALDLFPPSAQNYTNSYIEILAPKSGTLNRVCVDSQNISAAVGEMRILHMSTSDFSGIVNQDVSVKKSQKIGKVATQDNL